LLGDSKTKRELRKKSIFEQSDGASEALYSFNNTAKVAFFNCKLKIIFFFLNIF